MADYIVKKMNGAPETGADRMFGSPDVWDDFDWPVATDRYGNESDMAFLCQINCKALQSEYLPCDGIMYFFYDAINRPSTPNIKGGAKVLLYKGDTDALSEMRLVDEDGNDVSPKAYSLIPTDDEGDVCILPKDEAEEFDDEYDEEYDLVDEADLDDEVYEDDSVVLAVFNAFEDENVSFTFENGTQLCFLISRKSLENGDFSDIRVFVA